MSMKSVGVAGLALVLLSACVTDGAGTKQTFGTVLGAAGGAVAGAQFGKGKGQLVGVAAGTLLGAMLGNSVGQSLDRADQMAMGQATQKALETAPSGTPTHWSNPDSGHAGTVTPEPAYKQADGRYCREFQQTVMVGGREERAYGTACRQPDGSWQIVNADTATASVQSSYRDAVPPPPQHRW